MTVADWMALGFAALSRASDLTDRGKQLTADTYRSAAAKAYARAEALKQGRVLP